MITQSQYLPTKLKRAKYFANHDTFKEMNNEKAFVLGLLAADGSITDTSVVRLELQADDIELVQLFKKILQAEHPIHIQKRRRYNKPVKDMARFFIRSAILTADLAEYGVIPRKSEIHQFPTKLDSKFYRDYIRGYFDGDGCISHWVSHGYRSGSVCMEGTLDCLSKMKEILLTAGLSSIAIYKRGKMYHLHIGRKTEVKKFYDYIYSDPTQPYLRRKKAKFKEFFDKVGIQL